MKSFTLFLSGLTLGLLLISASQHSSNATTAGGAAFFSDVESFAYYNEGAASMASKGVVTGYDDGRFGPNDPVTRGQVVTMLHRYDRSVVQPLREQIAKLRRLVGTGECGDGKKDVGEQCDDGNDVDGDGCSSICLLEHRPKPPVRQECEGGYKAGESFTAPDGCNTCFCDEFGQIACTEMACISPEKKMCLEKEQDLADIFRGSRACRTDDDCAVYVRGCGPYLTCGKPVNTASLGKVKEAVAAYVEECPTQGPEVCAGCAQQTAVCDGGFCRLQQLKACTQEVKICPDGSSVSRNPSLDCEFNPCPSEVDPGDECEPYVCADGTKHPRCSEDGTVINYFADPCLGHDAVCGNGVCEEGEADDPGGCGPNADPLCLGPPAREGSCPEDCG